ncbi:MAG: AraC family transcriptional regulator [Clostridia bacterium]|nr:AraC family transcriptional regulator [Clostridia bacterium]
MTVSGLVKELNLTVLTNKEYADREVKGCYVGDLLSWVMGRAEQDSAWITIMSNINIVAVAALVDMACIILAEGVAVDKEVIDKANSQGIIILSTDKNSYELAVAIHSAAGI